MNGTPCQHEPDIVDHAADALRAAPRPAGPPPLVVERTIEALVRGGASDALPPRQTPRPVARFRRLFQLAAAIILIVSIGVASFLVVSSSRPALAFSTVVQSLTTARTVVYDATITELRKPAATKPSRMGSATTAPSDKPDEPTVMHISVLVPGHVRQEIPKLNLTQVLDFNTSRGVALMDKDKLALVIDLKGKLDKVQGDPARFIIERLKTTNSAAAQQLGRRTFAGRELVGFRVTVDDAPCTIWADEQTGAAVRMEFEVPLGDGGLRIVVDHIVFDRDLPDALFTTEAPAGYRVQKMSADISAPVEADLIKLLEAYAKQTGEYPRDLNDVKSIYAALTLPTQPADFKLHPELVETAYALNRGVFFASTIVAQSPWYYAPADVKPGDSNAVLLWYTTRDEKDKPGPVHAIMADLSVHEAKPETLPPSNHAATATRPVVKF